MRKNAHGALAARPALLPRGAEPRLVRWVALPGRHELGLRMRVATHEPTRTMTLQQK